MRSGTLGRSSYTLQGNQHTCQSTVSSKSLGPLLLFLMFWANFWREVVLSSSDEVYDVSISWNYTLLSMANNFTLGKLTKIERNRGKLLPIRTSLVDWRVYMWEKRVKQYARIVWASLKVDRYDCLPPRSSLAFQPSLFGIEN